ncbi:MAG: MazG family protein [Bryobacter sp.]|nr:MazG family protein [Bryobacter sp.]
MARLRGPGGCPWDHEQDHLSLRFHAVEEVYELLDAIEAGDDHAMEEELGDLLLQIVFHAQMAKERGAFDFEAVARRITNKLIHRHPHVFGKARIKDAAGVLAQWDQLKHAEKKGTRHERASALDGIPKHLPALLHAEKLVKKARKAQLLADTVPGRKPAQRVLARRLFALVRLAQQRGWSAEELLRRETRREERGLRRVEGARRKRG